MSSRKSDNLAHKPFWNGWLSTLLCNLPIPLLILLLIWVGTYVDSRDFIRGYGWQRNVIFDTGFAIILAVSLQLINGFSGQFSLGHIGFMMVGAFLAAYPVQKLSAKYTAPGPMLNFFVALGITTAVLGFALLLMFTAMRASRKLHASVPAILIAVLFVWLLIDFSAAQHYSDGPPWFFLWTHAVSGIGSLFEWLSVHGQPYAAKLTELTPESLRSTFCILIAIIGGASCAGVVGLVVGMPALRLRGDYLAIATLGFGEIINRVIILTPALGGALGLPGIPRIKDTDVAKQYYVGEFAWLYIMVVITIAVIWRLAYSAKGRAIMAVREDEIAAKAVGIDATHHKVMAFVVGAFFAGIAGALYAMMKSSVDPKTFTMTRSIEIVVMVTLGGLGSISGAILAAILLTILPEQLRDPQSSWPWGFIIVAALFVAYGIYPAIARTRRNLPLIVGLGIALLLIACSLIPYIRVGFEMEGATIPQHWPSLTMIGVASVVIMALMPVAVDRSLVWPVLVYAGLLVGWNVMRTLAAKYEVDLPALRWVIYSLTLIVIMLLRPQGLLGGRELWPKRRAPAREAAPTEENRDQDRDASLEPA